MATRILEQDFSFIKKHKNINQEEIDKLIIQINYEDWEKFLLYRDSALYEDLMLNKFQKKLSV